MNQAIRYRIYTEDKNRDRVFAILNLYVLGRQGYTVYSGVGVWQGQQEASLILEFVVLGAGQEFNADKVIEVIAARIKQENDQEAVLVTQEVIEGRLV